MTQIHKFVDRVGHSAREFRQQLRRRVNPRIIFDRRQRLRHGVGIGVAFEVGNFADDFRRHDEVDECIGALGCGASLGIASISNQRIVPSLGMLYLISVVRVRFDEPSGKWFIVRIGRKEGANVIGHIRRVCLLHNIPVV